MLVSLFSKIYLKVIFVLFIKKISIKIQIAKQINLIEDFIYSWLSFFLKTGKKLIIVKKIINNSFGIYKLSKINKKIAMIKTVIWILRDIVFNIKKNKGYITLEWIINNCPQSQKANKKYAKIGISLKI